MSFDQTLIADLLDQWLGGQSPDWDRLYPAGRPPIEHAPTYPFARNVYWVHAADRTPEPGLAAAPARSRDAAPPLEAGTMPAAAIAVVGATAAATATTAVTARAATTVTNAIDATDATNATNATNATAATTAAAATTAVTASGATGASAAIVLKSAADEARRHFTPSRERAPVVLRALAPAAADVAEVTDVAASRAAQTQVFDGAAVEAARLAPDAIGAALIDSLARRLLVSPQSIGARDAFDALGVDSLIGQEWLRELNRTYGTSIDGATLAECGHIGALASRIAGARADAAAPAWVPRAAPPQRARRARPPRASPVCALQPKPPP
ncbi:hypothetical protein AQ903_20375 [Burkholderia pseudomallei]|nr:acyl carrier protein [Burkholderia pseudomallei]ONB69828.1 hypothetical protein AQ903_20375 [Burkholderia pseudomallei]